MTADPMVSATCERLAIMFDYVDQMVLLVDPDGLSIVFANQQAESLLGYSRSQLQTLSILDIDCSLQDVFYWEEVRAGQIEDIVRQEGLYLCADGSMREVEKSVKRLEYDQRTWLMIQARENSQSSDVADDLANASSQLRATLEATGNGILVIDGQGKIASMNRLFSRMWQIPEHILMSLDDSAIISFLMGRLPEADRLAFQQRFQQIIDSRETDDLLYLSDGRVFRCTSLPQYLDEGINGRVFGFSDITERIRIEQDLIASREKAEAANRAKAAFLAMMSHEIRTPLNGVVGMATLLGQTSLSGEQRRYLDVIGSSSEALLSIINDILDFSKIEAQKLTLEHIDFDLMTLVENMGCLNAIRAEEKGLELAMCIGAQVPRMIRGDPGRLNQILLNLVSNAIKFTSTGAVSIEVALVTNPIEGEQLQFTVRDSGIGIAAENLDKVFAPFEQADSTTTRRFGGTGLGLAICHQLTSLMGGSITLESKLGKGTAFTVLLPCERSVIVSPSATESFEVSSGHLLGKNQSFHVADRSFLKNYVVVILVRNKVARDGAAALFERLGMVVEAPSDVSQWLDEKEQLVVKAPMFFVVDQKDAKALYDRIDITLLPQNKPSAVGMIECVPVSYCPETTVDLQHDTIACIEKYYWHRPGTLSDLMGLLEQMQKTTEVVAAHAGIEEAPSCSVGGAQASKRILVVEDNRVNMMVIKGFLKRLGYESLVLAKDGQEAVEMVAQEEPDLVLMDCQMPRLDGYEACKRLREQGISLPVIAMTANALTGDKEKCLAAGMDDYISKPIVFDLLAETLRKWLGPNG